MPKYTQNIFNGLLVGVDKTDMPSEYTPDCENVVLSKRGEVKSMPGMKKVFSFAFDGPVDHIHQAGSTSFYVSNGDVRTTIPDPYPDSTTFGTYGSSTNQFIKPMGTHFDTETDLFAVADAGRHQIILCKLDGSVFIVIGEYGSGDWQFSAPSAITMDDSGNYLVADTGNDRIVRFDRNLTTWEAVGSSGSGNYQFSSCEGIAWDPDGYIHTTDRGLHRVAKWKFDQSYWYNFGSQGETIWKFNYPRGIVFDRLTKKIYVGMRGGIRQYTYEVAGEWNTFGSFGSGTNQFDYIHGIDINTTTKELLIGDYANNRVVNTKIDGGSWSTYSLSNKALGVSLDSVLGYLYGGVETGGYVFRLKEDII